MARHTDERPHGFGAVLVEASSCLVEHHSQLTVDIELSLVVSRVAEADGLGAFVAV
jgi:hypothetical protein